MTKPVITWEKEEKNSQKKKIDYARKVKKITTFSNISIIIDFLENILIYFYRYSIQATFTEKPQ